MRKPYIIGILIRDKIGPPALAKLDVKEFRYPYHNFRGININDNGLKSSSLFKVDDLLLTEESRIPQEQKINFHAFTHFNPYSIFNNKFRISIVNAYILGESPYR